MKPFQTLLYYKYTHLPEAEIFAQQHLKFCKEIGVKGRILIAEEGINGTCCGTPDQCKLYMEELTNDRRFEGIEFKIDETDEPSFSKIFVRYRKEIVHFGQDKVNVWEHAGHYLEPAEWEKMMNDDDVVVIDARNKVEWELGKFKNAVTLDIKTFRDFPEKLNELEQYKNKKVLAYCTGGIRCEKATAFLQENGFENVFHLHGGIIRYGKETGGKDFEGQCYVFDSRLGVDINSVNPTVISHCRICNSPTTKMINCANPECNEHFVICESCGVKMEGTCSDVCHSHPRRRVYDGSGYYQKQGQAFVNPKAAKKKWLESKTTSTKTNPITEQ